MSGSWPLSGASPGSIYCAEHLVTCCCQVRGCHRYVVNEEGSIGPSVTSKAPRVSEVEGALWVTKGNTSVAKQLSLLERPAR